MGSVVDVIANPTDPWAWAGLVGDIVDVAVPFVAGVGEVVDAVKATKTAVEVVDDVYDAAKTVDRIDDAVDSAKVATTGTPNEIGKIGEQLAGIDPKAKVSINVNGKTRIPDKLTDIKLTEVKNVKYISNTSQLRDFAQYAAEMEMFK